MSRLPQPGAQSEKKTPEQQAAEHFERLVDQRLEQRDAHRAHAAEIAQFHERAAAVQEKHPDFAEVVSTLDVPSNSPLGQALLTSDVGPEIMYELAKNRAELARISALPPLIAVREIGRLEAKLTSGATPQTLKTAPKKPSAPAPITPVTTRGPSTVKRTEDMSYEEYSTWRRAQAKR